MIRIDAVSSYKYPNYSKKNLKTDSLNQQILVNLKNNEENLSFKSSFLKNANKKNMLSAYRTAFVTMLGFVGIKVAKNTKAKEKDPVSSKQILLNHLNMDQNILYMSYFLFYIFREVHFQYYIVYFLFFQQ